MPSLYHGSAQGGLTELKAFSSLHGRGDRVLYLTDCVPYALFYIWDGARLGSGRKHVTGSVRQGRAWYEEQFPGQLEAFYEGASGWLYRVEPASGAEPLAGREALFYAQGDQPVAGAAFIPDVHRVLLDWEARGMLEVSRFEDRTLAVQEELTGRIAQMIAQNSFYQGKPEADFYRRFFREAWALAERGGGIGWEQGNAIGTSPERALL